MDQKIRMNTYCVVLVIVLVAFVVRLGVAEQAALVVEVGSHL